jgi:hypothetical protein
MLNLTICRNNKINIFKQFYQNLSKTNTYSQLYNKINYRNYYCELYEKNQEELKLLNELNTSNKEKIYIIEMLKKIESQNKLLIINMKNLNNKINQINSINQINQINNNKNNKN